MAEKKREVIEPRVNVPTQQDEEEILEEVGGERDEETGELLVDEDRVREIGAIDPETLRRTRHVRSVANKQKTGKKGVSWGTDDPLDKYDGLLKVWGPNSIYIRVKRLTGAQVSDVIRSCPRSGLELHAALMAFHGQNPEAEYALDFRSTDGHQMRGTGRITLPDTRPAAQQGQPMPYGMPRLGYPTPVQPAQSMSQNPVEMFGQMFEMFQRFSQRQQQPQQPPMMPPPPPAGSDMPTQMAWMQQMFELFQQMQGKSQRAFVPPQPPPPSPPQAGLSEQMALFREMFQMFREMQPPAQATMRERPYFAPNGGVRAPQEPPPRQLSPTERLREAFGEVRSIISVANEFDAILPGRQTGFEAPIPEDDDSPVRVEKIGDIETVRDRDGTMRWGETLLSNVPSGFKWFSEQMRKANEERQRREQPAELPPGFVELKPGYQPPPGYTVVPIESVAPVAQAPQQSEQPLPPPPANMPPPIQSTSWDMPPTNEGEGEG